MDCTACIVSQQPLDLVYALHNSSTLIVNEDMNDSYFVTLTDPESPDILSYQVCWISAIQFPSLSTSAAFVRGLRRDSTIWVVEATVLNTTTKIIPYKYKASIADLPIHLFIAAIQL